MNHELLILNRALPIEYGTDEMPKRIHIVPRGELVNNEAGVTQVFDDKSIDAIYSDLVQNKAKDGGLYLGEEHFIYDPEKSSQAFAWAKTFEKDDRGIWATNPEFTDVGAPAIKNKRFKWTSLVADPEQPNSVEKVADGRVRILKIDTVGFTNYPNGKTLLTPITNRGGGNLDDASSSAAASSQTKTQKTKMKNIAVELGLDPNTDEAGIVAVVRKLMNRGDIPVAELATLKNRKTELETENKTLLDEQIDGLLSEHGVKDEKIVNRLKPVLAGLKNRADRVAALTDFGYKPGQAAPASSSQSQSSRVLNRGNGGASNQQEQAAGADAAEDRAAKIMNRATQITKETPTISLATATAMASREIK